MSTRILLVNTSVTRPTREQVRTVDRQIGETLFQGTGLAYQGYTLVSGQLAAQFGGDSQSLGRARSHYEEVPRGYQIQIWETRHLAGNESTSVCVQRINSRKPDTLS